jgi:P4 family phage/plasmid primase-like protien
VSPENVPPELRDRDQWVIWAEEERDGKPTKVPRQPATPAQSADVPNELAHRSDFETALTAVEEHDDLAGIGFVFDGEDLVVGVDLDDCRDPETGELEDWAADVVDRLDSYTEVSPSGTGLHVYALGAKPGDRCRRGDLEMYDNDRFFTVTGAHLEGTPETVNTRPEAIRRVYEDYLADGDSDDGPDLERPGEVDLADDELLEKAMAAAGGGKFARLWAGDTSMHDGDHSRADLAMLCKLAFWTGGDRARMEQLFNRSGLARDKWRDRPDYRERSIDAALEQTTDYYEPAGVNPSDPDSDGEPNQGVAAEEATGSAGNGENDHDGGSGFAWGQVEDLFESDADGTTTRGYSVAASILCRDHDFVTLRQSDAIYHYQPDLGYYVRKGETFVDELVERNIPDHVNTTRLRNIREKVRNRNFIEIDEFVPPEGKVNLQNGVLDLERWAEDPDDALEGHSADYYFTARLDVRFDPDADDGGVWEGALEDATPRPGERKKIEEFVGYCLEAWTTDQEKAMFFVGWSRSGKSTIQETIENLFGDAPTVTNLSPHQLADTRFDVAALREATLNTANDINAGKIEDTGMLKRMISGERMKMENKYEDRHFSAPKAKHLWTANWLPLLVGMDDAVYRRVLIVEFPNQVPEEEQSTGYKKRLKREDVRQVLLNRALEARERMRERDGFTNDRGLVETRRKWDSWRDSLKRFLYTQFEITGDPSDIVERKAFWQAYSEYAARMGCERKSNVAVTKSLQYVPEIDASGERDDYGGLRWREVDAADEEPKQQRLNVDSYDKQIHRVRAIVDKLAGDRAAAREDVVARAIQDGIDEDKAEHIIEKLLRRGELTEPETDNLRLT